MANHALPTTTSLYTDVLINLKDRIDDSVKMMDSVNTSPTNIPTNAIRWNSTTTLWEKYSGSAWGSLAASYAIQVLKSSNLVGGNSTTLLGSIPYQSNTNITSLLSPNTTTTRKFLRQTGSGTNGSSPVWDTILAADVPTLNQNTTGSSGSCTGTSSKATNLVGGNNTTLLGSIPYQSNTDITTLLAPNTTAVPKVLMMTGTGTNGKTPAWTEIEDRLGTPIASAATTTIGTAGLGDYIHITGTTTITSFGTASTAGTRRTLIFDGALTLTHNATSLICVGGGNILTVAGMVIEVVAETTANWRVVSITHPNVSPTELGYLDGVTGNIQTQFTGKQATLVSGTNIKTINSNSILGSGDLVVGETTWTANDTRAKTALNASGSAPIYACRAWVNFNGTGTVAIRASGNVSSITDNGVGNYRGNFIVALPDSNYATNVSFNSGDANAFFAAAGRLSNVQSTTSFVIESISSAGNIDCLNCYAAIFR